MLEGGIVTTAVNIPVVDQADLETLGPFIPLAGRLGRLSVELADGRVERIVVAAHGPLSDYDTRLLTVAALNVGGPGGFCDLRLRAIPATPPFPGRWSSASCWSPGS